jgi:putative flippase GtrA
VKEFSRFVAVGIANTLLGYAVIFAFMYLARWSPEASNAAGYGVGLLMSYLMNRSFTFRSSNNRGPEFIRFLVVFALAYGVNFAVLALSLYVLSTPAWMAQILAGIAYVATSFLLNRAYVFSASAGTGRRR